jgi:hypothetical protein
MSETYTRVWVDRTSIDVKVVLGKNLWSLINCSSRSIEDTSQHVLGDTKLQALTSKLNFRLFAISMPSLLQNSSVPTFLTSIPDVPSNT